jgi:formate dehydrogenase subunit gamma
MSILRTFAALALAVGMLAAPVAQAQQQINPTASAVQEDQLLQALGAQGTISGRVSIPNQDAAGLIKPGGQDWRATHGGTLFWLTAGSAVGMIALLAVFYMVRGRIRIESGWSGVKILRFNGLERFAHWMTATCFIILALTGLNLVVGRYVLMPLIGPEAFAWLTQMGKLGHNYLAWPFMVGVALMFLIWVKDNIPGKYDGAWLAAGGGLMGDSPPPAPRFNAGQKIIFWSVVLGGAALSVTGVLLLFPELAGGYAEWQQAQVIHGIVAAVLAAIMIAHIYIGSVGMEGAFDAMGSGEVDLSWAREHHSVWVDDMRKAGKAGPAPTGRPAATPAE